MISAIVLAAGLSTRMGKSKPLLPFGSRTLITHIVEILRETPLDEILVITGHERAALEKLFVDSSAQTIFNSDYAAGEMLSSVQIGLQSASLQSSAALIVLGDQPALEASVVAQIISAFRDKRGSVVFPSYKMRRGHPILIAREHWPAILELRADQTLRDFFRGVSPDAIHHVSVNSPRITNAN
ncbi:MAG: nucleotidyltransferase family protein [Chloroflexi bacterium]|nr:nucleotidyltransferase family protein [Chloroflexota bacterium]